jgi:hypothetical protein
VRRRRSSQGDHVDNVPNKIEAQIRKARLPIHGNVPFVPKLDRNKVGEQRIRKLAVQHGPKKGKKGFVDSAGRIWIRDRAHAGVPDHWDVQEAGAEDYFRVDDDGNLLP